MGVRTVDAGSSDAGCCSLGWAVDGAAGTPAGRRLHLPLQSGLCADSVAQAGPPIAPLPPQAPYAAAFAKAALACPDHPRHVLAGCRSPRLVSLSSSAASRRLPRSAITALLQSQRQDGTAAAAAAAGAANATSRHAGRLCVLILRGHYYAVSSGAGHTGSSGTGPHTAWPQVSELRPEPRGPAAGGHHHGAGWGPQEGPNLPHLCKPSSC